MTVAAGYLPLFSNPPHRKNHCLGGGLISDDRPLQHIFEKILVAVLLTRFLFPFPSVIQRFILIIKLSIEHISITNAHNVDETHTHLIIYHSDDEAVARTCSDDFVVRKLATGYHTQRWPRLALNTRHTDWTPMTALQPVSLVHSSQSHVAQGMVVCRPSSLNMGYEMGA